MNPLILVAAVNSDVCGSELGRGVTLVSKCGVALRSTAMLVYSVLAAVIVLTEDRPLKTTGPSLPTQDRTHRSMSVWHWFADPIAQTMKLSGVRFGQEERGQSSRDSFGGTDVTWKRLQDSLLRQVIFISNKWGAMSSKLIDSMAHQLSLPKRGLMGWICLQILKKRNGPLEKNAARLCNIQPHHKVLEIGFGPGIGLQHALQYIKDGPGKLCGVELSSYMLETAAASLRIPISNKKVELTIGNVMHLPYSTDTFDRIFHCNCYYFWPSMQDALQEIYRVMKPGGLMVTCINLDSIKKSEARGFMKYGTTDPVKYMCALESTGFKNVRIEYFKDGAFNYQAMFAHLPAKESVEYD